MKEPPMQQRLLLAVGLWLLFMLGWSFFYRPATPPKPPASTPASAPAATSPAAGPAGTPQVGAPGAAPAPAGKVAAAEAAPGAIADTAERTLQVENDVYVAEFSNRGGTLRKFELRKYTDTHKKTLNLVNPESALQENAWPLAWVVEDPKLEEQLNNALFVADPAAGPLAAPVTLTFRYSDGRLAASKRMTFAPGYLFDIETSVTLEGKPLPHALAWRGGFGDVSEYAHAEKVKVFYSENGKLHSLEHKKLGVKDNPEQRHLQEGALRYAGIEDHYFAAAFLPRGARPEELGTAVAMWHWRHMRNLPPDNKKQEPVAEMAAGSTVPGPLSLRLFIGPKALDELRSTRPPLSELVQFGWLGIIAEPLFYLLKWIHSYVPNWGWAIILMTILLNTLLFPFKLWSWRAMQKMQRVMPEVKQIQDRYKKYSMTDPRRQQMNEEVMKVYKREGVNPMGSCLPMLIQLPIWFALYTMLGAAIELRHAPWLGWITDLSAKDPYYILPLLMAATMYVMQKMTPVTTTDPAQQRMMQIMPIMFGGMFLILPVSSGLVIYILTSNIVGMAQQWYLNRTGPQAARAAAGNKA